MGWWIPKEWGAVALAVLIAASMIVSPVLASSPTAPTTSEHDSLGSITETALANDGELIEQKHALRAKGHGNDNGNGNGNGPPGSSGDDNTGPESNITIPEYIENATVEDLDTLSSLEQRAWALSQLESIDPRNRKEHRRLTDAFESVNESVRSYVDWSRVEQSDTFDADRAALQALRHVKADSVVSNATTALVSSDRSLAAQSIEDAEYVLEEFDDEIEAPGQRRKAERQIENAKRALDRGDERRSEEKQGHNRDRQAIKQYEQAWKHAQKAIETVDSEVGLSLSVSTGQHEPGNETITYPISGTISAPSGTVETVEVYVDGEHHKTVNVSTSRAPGIPERFETELELPTTEATVTVVARDESSGDEVSETIALDAPGFADDVYDIELTDSESGAEVTVTGEGIVKSDFVVDHVPADEDRSFYAAPFIHIRNFSNFESATVEMPLDDDVDPSDGNLSMYKWDQHDEKPWHAVETDVHVENGTAVATVDSFSYFSVFWVDNWNDAITDTVNLDEHPKYVANESSGSIDPIDLAFVIDESGSMGGNRIQDAKASAKRFVGGLYEEDRAALVSFSSRELSSGARLEQSLTTDHDAVNASIDQLNAGGGTNTGAGLQAAIDELSSNGAADTQEIILLADGGTNEGPNPVEIAQTADEKGITINTIGMGTGINAQELTSIADATGGEFYQVSDSSELPEVFDRIEQNRVSLVDSDDDDIPDIVEDMHLSMTVGGPGMVGMGVDLKPDDPHTATDRLTDGNITEFEWVTYEEDGDTMITAKLIDASVHPGSGESVRKEVIKVGYLLPVKSNADTEDPVSEIRTSGGKDYDGYRIAPADEYVPSDRAFHGWPFLDPSPNWLPEDVVDTDWYHMKLEPTIVMQYTHDIPNEDLPREFEMEFTGSHKGTHGHHIYSGDSGELPLTRSHKTTELIVAAPSEMGSTYITNVGASIGKIRMDIHIPSESNIELDTAQSKSEFEYFYSTDAAERYEPVYNEALNIFKDAMISAASFSTGSTAWRAMQGANTMTQKGLIRAIKHSDKIRKVIDGEEKTGYNDMQAEIYSQFEDEDIVVTSAGPVLVISNETTSLQD